MGRMPVCVPSRRIFAEETPACAIESAVMYMIVFTLSIDLSSLFQ